MKKLIKLVVILAIGAFFGYVFHDTIDTKLKEKFGEETVETVKDSTREKVGKIAKDGKKVAEGAYEGGKNAMKNE